MEETSAISMELVLAALIALAVLLLLGWYILNSKIKALASDVETLKKERDGLLVRLNASEEKIAAVPVAQGKAAAATAEPAEPAVGEVPENTAEKPLQPAGEEAEDTKDIPSDSEIPPEVVAVIMAAVAACGYNPAAIRSIRRDTARTHQNHGWVMAGRLAGMR